MRCRSRGRSWSIWRIDALRVAGERYRGWLHRGLDIDQVAIYVITASALRLDHDRDRTRLWETARWLRPKLLVLDPLVRLHGIDENHAGEVAELLGYFRSLQRQLGISVLLVHHTRKNAGDGAAAGQDCVPGRYPCVSLIEPLSPANRAEPDTSASIGQAASCWSTWSWSPPTRRRLILR